MKHSIEFQKAGKSVSLENCASSRETDFKPYKKLRRVASSNV